MVGFAKVHVYHRMVSRIDLLAARVARAHAAITLAHKFKTNGLTRMSHLLYEKRLTEVVGTSEGVEELARRPQK